jgi:Zn-finger protein
MGSVRVTREVKVPLAEIVFYECPQQHQSCDATSCPYYFVFTYLDVMCMAMGMSAHSCNRASMEPLALTDLFLI